MRTYVILLILFSLLTACKTNQPASPAEKAKTEEVKTEAVELYGFRFWIPPGFVKTIDDIKAVDLKENIKSRETAFRDTLTGAEIHIIFHPEPYGKTLYDYYRSLADKHKATITNIAGLPAVGLTENIVFNGKGLPLDEPLVRQKYYVLDAADNCLELVLNRGIHKNETAKIFQQFIDKIQHK